MALRRLRQSPLFTLLVPLLAPHRRRLAVLVLLVMPLSAVMAMLIPYLTKIAIDDHIVPAMGSGDVGAASEPLAWLISIALTVVIFGYLADGIYISQLQRIGQHLIAALREQVYRHTLRLPRRYYDDHPIGSVLTRVTSDVDALGEGLASGVLGLFMDSLKTIAYLAMMFALDWRLTLILLLIGPPLAALMIFFQRRVRRTFFATRKSLSEATGYLQEVLNGMKTVQLFAAEQQVVARYKAKNRTYYNAQNAANFYDALLFSLIEGITTLALALLLWYAAGELLSGLLSLGVLVAFIEYSQRLFVPVREFAQQMAVLQRALGALDHIQQIVQETTDPALSDNTTASKASPVAARPHFDSLQFDRVGFRYRASGPLILDDVSFQLRRGQRLAIVGPSGSGKSTLIRLLTRAYGGYQGSIKINGQELSNIPADHLTRLLAVVHQSIFLYQGTLAFNVGLGRPEVDRERIEQVGHYVNLDRFVATLPNGYETSVAGSGANLSAGQGQLLALARALAESTDLIVLDEATSAIDSVTEVLIQAAVERLYRDKTVIAIAHRLSTVRSADLILVMDAGRVVESGDHQTLLTRGGLYSTLVGDLAGADDSSDNDTVLQG